MTNEVRLAALISSKVQSMRCVPAVEDRQQHLPCETREPSVTDVVEI